MNNERGGILSKLLIAPIGIALMVGFFFLGYYVGKYQSRSGAQSELMPPLPEVAAQHVPKKEEFTFYKTLSDKNEKTVSIELKPQKDDPSRKQTDVSKTADPKKTASADAPKAKPAQPVKKEQQPDNKTEKNAAAAKPKPQAVKPSQPKKEPVSAPAASPKTRYTLQIASYAEKAPADEEARRLKQRGYAAFVVAADVPGKGTWHRVRLGRFANKADAEKLQKELSAKVNITTILLAE